MISALLFSSSFLNFAFYIYAVGFVIALVLEQFVKKTDNEKIFLLLKQIANICGDKLGLSTLTGLHVM